MKKRKFKILKTETDASGIVTFHTKAGPFRYFLSNGKVLKHFLELNSHLLSKNDMCSNVTNAVGKFLFVPERNK